MENWKKYIFENGEKTLFETDNLSEMYDFFDEFQLLHDNLEFINIYESAYYTTIHFAGYNLMIKK